jgi:hypothetical protein
MKNIIINIILHAYSILLDIIFKSYLKKGLGHWVTKLMHGLSN